MRGVNFKGKIMSKNLENSLLNKVKTPNDLRLLNDEQLDQVSKELRNEVIEVVSQTGGHLGSSLLSLIHI